MVGPESVLRFLIRSTQLKWPSHTIAASSAASGRGVRSSAVASGGGDRPAHFAAVLAVPVDWEIDDARQQEYGASVMEAIAEKLGNKLHEWKPETSRKVRALVAEIIEQADDDALDLGRSRSVEQEVMDILDEPSTR